ncbi:Uncharacterised protein [Mycobacteroides abscessus subsp. abscessus]|nr:Uncharacterised protein [Mycobacteroides abscessus subsp. abscessus]
MSSRIANLAKECHLSLRSSCETAVSRSSTRRSSIRVKYRSATSAPSRSAMSAISMMSSRLNPYRQLATSLARSNGTPSATRSSVCLVTISRSWPRSHVVSLGLSSAMPSAKRLISAPTARGCGR